MHRGGGIGPERLEFFRHAPRSIHSVNFTVLDHRRAVYDIITQGSSKTGWITLVVVCESSMVFSEPNYAGSAHTMHHS